VIIIKETFNSTCVLDDFLLPNTWNIEIKAHPNGQKDKDFFTKAVERIQYFVFDVLENSIFVSYKNLSLLNNIPLRAQVHVFPDEPWDHLVSMCLYTKLTAICEEVLFIESITVGSLQSRTVSHNFGDQDGGGQVLHDLFKDDEEALDIIKHWYKPNPQVLLLHEGLKLVEQNWDDKDIDIKYEKSLDLVEGKVINLKEYKKKPPDKDNDNNA